MTTYRTYNLGNITVQATEVSQCKDCGSRSIEKVRGEPDKKAIADFVRSRAGRMGLDLSQFDVKIDKETGVVTATEKEPADIEIEFT